MKNRKFAVRLAIVSLAASVLGAFIAPGVTQAASEQPTTETITVTWILPAEFGPGDNPESTPLRDRMPQTRSYDGSVPCGRWAQVDTYGNGQDRGRTMTLAVLQQRVADLGNTLEWVSGGPEDKGLYVSHRNVYGGDCAPPTTTTTTTTTVPRTVYGPDFMKLLFCDTAGGQNIGDVVLTGVINGQAVTVGPGEVILKPFVNGEVVIKLEYEEQVVIDHTFVVPERCNEAPGDPVVNINIVAASECETLPTGSGSFTLNDNEAITGLFALAWKTGADRPEPEGEGANGASVVFDFSGFAPGDTVATQAVLFTYTGSFQGRVWESEVVYVAIPEDCITPPTTTTTTTVPPADEPPVADPPAEDPPPPATNLPPVPNTGGLQPLEDSSSGGWSMWHGIVVAIVAAMILTIVYGWYRSRHEEYDKVRSRA